MMTYNVPTLFYVLKIQQKKSQNPTFMVYMYLMHKQKNNWVNRKQINRDGRL